MGLQPGEGGRVLEAFLGRRLAGRADVQRVAAVVLAVAGRGVDREDLRQRQPARELALEDAELVVVAAVAGDRLQHHAVPRGGLAHGMPGAPGRGVQPQRPAPAVVAGEGQPVGFGHQRQPGARGIGIGLQPEALQALADAVQRQRCRHRAGTAWRWAVEHVQRRLQSGLARQARDQRLQAFGDDTASIKSFGLDVVTDLCDRLRAGGVPGIHFYTMNQSVATMDVVQRLGLS